MKSSRRELSTDMDVDRGIFKNNWITLFSTITIPKMDIALPKTEFSFYGVKFCNDRGCHCRDIVSNYIVLTC